MMYRMEKNAQIGELIQQRQDAKIDLAHLKVKSNSIASAHSAFGANQDCWCVDSPGATEVFLQFPKGLESGHPINLLGRAELTTHVREVVTAEGALAAIKAQLASLGITD